MVSTPLSAGGIPAPPGKVPRAVLEAVFDRAPVGVAVVDLEGRYLWVNPAFCDLTGASPDQLVGNWYLGPVLREDWDANLSEGRRAVAGEIDAYGLDERLVRPDGEVRWVHSQICLERDDGDNPVRFVAVVTDVTEERATLAAERAAAQAARTAEGRWRMLVDHQPGLGVAVYDTDLRIVSAGGPAFSAAGLDAETLVGKRASEVILPANQGVLLPLLARAVDGESGSAEYLAARTHRWFAVEVLPFADGGGQRRVLVVSRDTTALHSAAEAARVAEERFELAAEASPIAVAQVDLEGRYLRVNQAMCELFGRSRDELVGASVVALTEPDDRAEVQAVVDRMVAGEASDHRQDKRYLRADGQAIWVTANAVAVTGADGRPDHFLVHYVDIDARVRERQELAAAEDRARRLGDLAPDGVVVADLEGLILYANQATAALLGRPGADLVGENLTETHHALASPAAKRLAAVQSGQTVRNSRETLIRPGGDRVVVEVSSTLIDYDGRPAVLSVARDVTQTAALAELQERHRQSFEHAPIAIGLVALDGTWLAVNPALCHLFDLDAERLHRMTFQEITHPDDLEADLTLLAKTMVGEIPGYDIEKRYVRPDGSIVYAKLHVAVVCDEDGEPLYFVAQIEDLTERRQREDQVRQLADELQAANTALHQALDDAAAGEARYRALVDHLPETAAYLFDRDHRLRVATGAGPRQRGFVAEARLGKPLDEFLAPTQAADVHHLLDKAFAGHPTTTEVRDATSGRDHLVDVVAIDPSRTGGADEVLLVARDITDRKGKERQLAEAEARYEALVEHSSDLTAITDGDGLLRYLSPAWEQITATTVAEGLGLNLLGFVHPEDLARTADLRREMLTEPGRSVSFTCRIRHGTGWRHVEAVVTNRIEDPAVGGVVTNARDVTDRVLAANRLAHQAMHDPLTDLPNRSLLVDRLDHLLAQQRRHHQRCAVLFLDLDRFKNINDSLGHRAGDSLLVTIADRLRSVVRPADTVARLGGDEFVILAEDVPGAEMAFEVADRIRLVVTDPVQLGEHTVTVGCSIGIALSDRHRPDQLLQEADMALYRAKERGRNRSELYDQGMQVLARQRHDVEQTIRAALDQGRVAVHYQPIVELSTGRVTATEALARIRLPDGTLLGPHEFVPVAEDSGLIVPLGIAVLDLACAQQAEWSRTGQGPARLAVNVSGSQLLSSTFVDDVTTVLARHQLDPGMLSLEITESTLIDAGPSARRQIDRLKTLGVTLALDDFGTGWSSLAYLRRFPIDVLKIDRAFVAGLGADEGDTEVVRAVISLGRALRLTTVAEGVESERQHSMLHALGCDQAQGYRYGKPVEPDDLSRRRTAPEPTAG